MFVLLKAEEFRVFDDVAMRVEKVSLEKTCRLNVALADHGVLAARNQKDILSVALFSKIPCPALCKVVVLKREMPLLHPSSFSSPIFSRKKYSTPAVSPVSPDATQLVAIGISSSVFFVSTANPRNLPSPPIGSDL